jgi:hypothetical protein
MAAAVNGDVGTMVETVQKQILRYYTDVGKQSSESFEAAKRVARWGFWLVAGTIVYVVIIDLLAHLEVGWFRVPSSGMNVGSIGLIGGAIVEVLAGVQFWLYGRATKQFGAFHICLERTHRYLLAYKIAEKINEQNRDQTLEKIVCIMANAPMITQADIDGGDTGRSAPVPQKAGTDVVVTAGGVGPGVTA